MDNPKHETSPPKYLVKDAAPICEGAEFLASIGVKTGLSLEEIAKRGGYSYRTLRRVVAGEIPLSKKMRDHLSLFSNLFIGATVWNSDARINMEDLGTGLVEEDPPAYGSGGSAGLGIWEAIVRICCSTMNPSQLTSVLSQLVNDEAIPSGIRSGVAKLITDELQRKL